MKFPGRGIVSGYPRRPPHGGRGLKCRVDAIVNIVYGVAPLTGGVD